MADAVNQNRSPYLLNHRYNAQWLRFGAVKVADTESNRVVELHNIDGRWPVVWSPGGQWDRVRLVAERRLTP